MDNKTFDIIKFTAKDKHYYGDSLILPDRLLKKSNLVKASSIKIPLGHSRYGGPIADLPKGFEYPEDLRFAAQLDLKQFSPHDKLGLLPKTGHLIFFAHIKTGKGKVIYTNLENQQLVRTIKDHNDTFYNGVLIDKIFSATENLESRYREPEDEDEKEDANNDGKIWDDFAGSETSKIFGIHTHCQLSEEDILDYLNSDKVVLLQVGENGFNDEGVFSVLIDKADLKEKNFDNCTFVWGQS